MDAVGKLDSATSNGSGHQCFGKEITFGDSGSDTFGGIIGNLSLDTGSFTCTAINSKGNGCSLIGIFGDGTGGKSENDSAGVTSYLINIDGLGAEEETKT